MPELIQEYVDSGSQHLRIEREAGILRGVKVLGLKSRNGRLYREEALRDAASLYEASKVNVNHPKGNPLAPRDYEDRIGVIRSVNFRAGEGLFGDLHFNPKHALGEQLIWDAEHEPANVGLSHNVLARTSRDGEITVVEAITNVQSVDLVADPAATRGLFEEEEPEQVPAPQSPHDGPAIDIRWDALVLEQLRRHRPDLVAQCQHVLQQQLDDTRAELKRIRTRTAADERRTRITELLAEHRLPQPQSQSADALQIVSHQFLRELMNAADDAALVKLVEERAALVRSAQRFAAATEEQPGRPTSRDQATVLAGTRPEPVESAEQFAVALRA